MNKLFSRTYFIEAVLFINGGLILALELLGVRILASNVGTTITVWSAVISVILFAVSVGYTLGGFLADRKLNKNVLADLSFIAGFLIFLIIPFRADIPTLFSSFSYGVNGLFSSLLLFAPATIFLSMITTYAIRLRVKNVETIATTNGILYGVSTAGSLFGVFLVSFYLVPNFNISTIILILGLSSFLNSFFSLGSRNTL